MLDLIFAAIGDNANHDPLLDRNGNG